MIFGLEASCPITIKFIILKFSNKYMKALSSKAASVDSKQSYFKNNYVSSQSYRQIQATKQLEHRGQNGYKQNEDLDWLEKLVHGFQWYKDRKNNLFDEQCATETNSKNFDSSFAKIQLNQSCQRHSQRKTLNDITRKYIQKSKQFKQQTANKNMSCSKNIVRGKRIESENSITKKKSMQQIDYSKLKSKQYKKENSIQNSKCNNKYVKVGDFMENIQQLETKNQLCKMKSKMSLIQNRNKVNFTKKVENVKAVRKDFIEAVAQTKKNFGKIVKNNKSLELKQRKQINQNQKVIINIVDITGKKQENKNVLSQIKYDQNNNKNIKQDFKSSQKKSQKKIIEDQQIIDNKIQAKLGILNQINIQNKHNKQMSQPESSGRVKQFLKKFSSQKPLNKEGEQIVQKQLQFKKYKYYIQIKDKNVEPRQPHSSFTKKQRKLNSSFGERKIYNKQNTLLAAKTASLTKLQQSGISATDTNQHKVCNSVIITNRNTKQLQNTKYSTDKGDDTSNKEEHIKERQNQRFKDLYNHNVKFVESTKNSQILTEQSYVIERPQINDKIQNQQNIKSYDNYGFNEQWNIMEIFSKLDSRRIGQLTANNCSIQNVSRQIRYILGPVLQQILYKDINYSFSAFINRVQTTLQNIKDNVSHIPKFNSKQVFNHNNSKDQFSQKFKFRKQKISNTDYNHEIHKEPLNSAVKLIQSINNGSSHKKYDYSKTFIQTIQTQPIISHKNDSKPIRFATFQDQQFIEKGNSFIKYQKDYDNFEFKIQREVTMQEKLQQKLQSLNQFKSTLVTGENLKTKIECQYNSIKPKVESERRHYQNQIVKLEMLNKRLQKYLVDQTMKEFSASKLLISDI